MQLEVLEEAISEGRRTDVGVLDEYLKANVDLYKFYYDNATALAALPPDIRKKYAILLKEEALAHGTNFQTYLNGTNAEMAHFCGLKADAYTLAASFEKTEKNISDDVILPQEIAAANWYRMATTRMTTPRPKPNPPQSL